MYHERFIEHTLENLITIELFGQTYTFKTESEMDKANAVADSLINEVNRIQEQGPGQQSSEMAKLTILILAALNLANENYDLKLNHSAFVSQIADRSKSLVHRIDQSINQKV